MLGSADYAFPGNWLLDTDLKGAEVFVWIVVAYILGHAIAQVSATLLEKGLVKQWLDYPTKALFGTSTRRWPFPGYFEPLPPQIREHIKANAPEGITGEAALFMYCDARVKKDEETGALLTIFLSLYGFARNVCIAAVVAGILLVVGAIRYEADRDTKLWLAVGAAAMAVFLLYRYLKFFRVYALEMFNAYAANFPEPTKAD